MISATTSKAFAVFRDPEDHTLTQVSPVMAWKEVPTGLPSDANVVGLIVANGSPALVRCDHIGGAGMFRGYRTWLELSEAEKLWVEGRERA